MLHLRITVAIFLLICACATGASDEPSTERKFEPSHQMLSGRTATLDNGMEIVFIENHANPMIACVTVVKTGLVNEARANNGTSHMLEHLLFNGTRTRTQEQLYHETDFYGIYNNAHTDELYTNFMVLAPAEFIEKALDIQSDMLFNSTIPPEKLEKERGIVIEEIGKDKDRIEYVAEQFFRSVYYRDTPYALPVLGTVTSINNLTREQILDYYHAYYVPNNMTAVVIGDFKTEALLELMRKYFGKYPAKDLPERKTRRVQANPIKEDLQVQRAKTNRTYLNLGLAAPGIEHSDFYTFYMLNEVLSSGANAPLPTALRSGAKPLALRVASEYAYKKDSGVLKINVTAAPNGSKKEIIETIKKAFDKLSSDPLPEKELKSLITSIKTNDIFLSEKLHYYGMSLSPLLAMAPYSVVSAWVENLEKVTPQEVQRVAKAYLKGPFVATAIEPWEAMRETIEKPPAKMTKKVFDNGLTLIVNENQDSRVFAVHVLAKNRSASEPPGKAGIADVMHQMLLMGTKHRNKSQIYDTLKSLGAALKVSDDPTIPYDDFYTTPAYSYIRFETIDDFYEPGLELLSDLMNNPTFDEAELAKVKAQNIDLIKKNRESVRERAKEKFYQTLCPSLPEARSVMGSEEAVSSVIRKDLIEFHKRYFAPNNLIITIVTNVPTDHVIARTQKLFDRPRQELFPVTDRRPCTAQGPKQVAEKAGKGQFYLYLGAILNEVAPADRAALDIMNAILSSRIAFELREKKGLAYALGTSLGLHDGWGWLVATIGTRPQNLEAARRGILEQIETMRTAASDAKEVEKNINAYVGRMLMRRLSRINAAYYYGLYEFEGLGYDYYERSLAEWRKVTKDDVERVANKYLPRDQFVTVILE